MSKKHKQSSKNNKARDSKHKYLTRWRKFQESLGLWIIFLALLVAAITVTKTVTITSQTSKAPARQIKKSFTPKVKPKFYTKRLSYKQVKNKANVYKLAYFKEVPDIQTSVTKSSTNSTITKHYALGIYTSKKHIKDIDLITDTNASKGEVHEIIDSHIKQSWVYYNKNANNKFVVYVHKAFKVKHKKHKKPKQNTWQAYY